MVVVAELRVSCRGRIEPGSGDEVLEGQAAEPENGDADQEPVDELAGDRGRVLGERRGTVDARRISN